MEKGEHGMPVPKVEHDQSVGDMQVWRPPDARNTDSILSSGRRCRWSMSVSFQKSILRVLRSNKEVVRRIRVCHLTT